MKLVSKVSPYRDRDRDITDFVSSVFPKMIPIGTGLLTPPPIPPLPHPVSGVGTVWPKKEIPSIFGRGWLPCGRGFGGGRGRGARLRNNLRDSCPLGWGWPSGGVGVGIALGARLWHNVNGLGLGQHPHVSTQSLQVHPSAAKRGEGNALGIFVPGGGHDKLL